MPLKSNKIALIAAVAAAGLGGTAIANAATGTTGATGATGSAGEKREHRSNETALTGDTAAKVKAAALAKVPGTVDRVETDDGGVYEAHVTKTDGTEVEVKVDKAFKVTAVEAHGDHGGRGHGDHGGGGAGETALTGDTAAKVEAAALAKVPGTVDRVETDNGGVYEAHVTKTDGTEVEVKVDKAFKVTAVEAH